jgi:phosphoribosyl-ATP pyrophosphohydrolase/phosphoribosyl-AMP cyclohydrolase
MTEAGAIRTHGGLMTAVVQDATTGDVLMVAHMNKEALDRTLSTGQGWYWSRSRKRLWRKGEESGHVQTVRAVRVDCDADAVLLSVDQVGSACHTGHRSCFYRTVTAPKDGLLFTEDPADGGAGNRGGAGEPSERKPRGTDAGAAGPEILTDVAAVLEDRRRRPREGSYSSGLFADGLARLNEKIMEEASEVTRAARKETSARLVEEAADLWFHTLALLVYQGIDPADVFHELAKRRR